MTPLPKKLNSRASSAAWLNQLRQCVSERTVQFSSNVKLLHHVNGFLFDQPSKARNEKSEPGGKVNQYLVKQLFGDYLRCRKIDGSTVGTQDVYIAKPFELRRTPWHGVTVSYTIEEFSTTLTVITVQISYDYKSGTYRIGTILSTSSTEHQTIIPRYVPDKSVIYASDVEETILVTEESAVDVTKIDLNVGARAWAKVL